MILEIVCHRSNETFRILRVSLSPIPLTAHQITINSIIQYNIRRNISWELIVMKDILPPSPVMLRFNLWQTLKMFLLSCHTSIRRRRPPPHVCPSHSESAFQFFFGRVIPSSTFTFSSIFIFRRIVTLKLSHSTVNFLTLCHALCRCLLSGFFS